MNTRAKSTSVTADQEQASSAESSGKKGADGGAGVVAGRSAEKHEHTRGVAPCYRIQMHLGKDLFEGFFNRNGKRDGKGRYTWADGTIGLCNWSDGRCDRFDEACEKYTKAEQQKTKRARAPTLERQKYDNKSGSFRLAKPKCDRCQKPEEFTFKCYKCATAYCKECEKETRKEGQPCICLESFSTLERQQYWGMCVKSGEACKEFTFKCLNCETAYCKRCEKQTRVEAFKKRRPPCKCLIDAKGIAVEIQGAALDLDDWKPWSVREHFQDGRRASANVQDLIFVIEFRRKGASQHHIKALCHIGSLESHIQSQLLERKEIQEYVANFPGSKPPAFCELQTQWQKPPQPYPKISLHISRTFTCQNSPYNMNFQSFFKEGRLKLEQVGRRLTRLKAFASFADLGHP